MREKIEKTVLIIIGILLIILAIFYFILKSKDIQETDIDEISYSEQLKEDYNSKKLKTNPYTLSNDYDGIYKFILKSDNGYGHVFTSIGVIQFNNGKCKIKYECKGDTDSYAREQEYNGFCGLNKENDPIFYFSLNDDTYYEVKTYRCILNGNNFLCELKSKHDLSGCSNKNLDLIYVVNSNDFDEILLQVLKEEEQRKEQEEKEKKEKEEREFKESCQAYTFEEIARNPVNFKGTHVKVTGEVVQVIQDSNSTNLRVNITKKGTYSTYYTDTIYVVYHQEYGEDKILENDIVTIYGISQGDSSYTTVLGSNITLPNIKAEYITIEK